jgi:hypothetical protein
LQDELVDHEPRGIPSRSATPPQAAEILDFGDLSSATKTGDVADKNGRKSAENLICGGVADRGKGSDWNDMTANPKRGGGAGATPLVKVSANG